MYQAQVRAMQAIYEAEVLRGQRDPDAGAAWGRAAEACIEGELRWDESYARWRAAQTMLADRSTRDEAVTTLRRAHELAVYLQAAPLLVGIEALARTAAVVLDGTVVGPLSATAALLPGLTPQAGAASAPSPGARTARSLARWLSAKKP